MQIFKINNRKIGVKYPPYIIAEMSGNHDQSIGKAFRIIDLAKKIGVDAIKLQTFTPDAITLKTKKKSFIISDKNSLWRNSSLYDLYTKAHTPRAWHEKIFLYCKKKKITCFSSVFDESAVDFLEKFDVPAYKIASFENNHFPLIEKVISKKKPIIISTGMTTFSEIKELIKLFKIHNFNKYALLKCTSSYPADPKDSNISTIAIMREKFECEVGLSDHTLGIGAAIASIAFGSSIIEKHFTLDRKKGGIDSAFSLNPLEMRNLVTETKAAHQSLGRVFFGVTKSEKDSVRYRRSIYFSQNLKKNEIINENNIKIIRPGFGLKPIFYKKILGKRLRTKVNFADPVLKKNIIF